MSARARSRPRREAPPAREKSTTISASGRVHSCERVLENPEVRLCSKQSPPSASCSVDELPRRFDRAEIAEIFVTAAGKPDEPFRFMGERKQALAKDDRNRGIVGAMHDEQRQPHPRYALVG